MNADKMPISEVLERSGFRLPAVWTKTDSRGPEYGEYRGRITPALRGGDTVLVSKWMPNASEPYWTTVFCSPQDFANWAADL